MSTNQRKELIINIIQQDLKHNQLLLGLDALGLEDKGVHSLQLQNVVANLMQVSEEKRFAWAEVYVNFINRAKNYDITSLGEALESLAKECYEGLMKRV